MALNIDGYNNAFKSFVDFAQNQIDKHQSKAIADARITGKFNGEEIACNASLDLAEQDPEKVFGMENNAATRFFGRGLSWSFTQTVANIPPAKRAVFYAAVDTAFPLVTDVAIARLPLFRRQGTKSPPSTKALSLPAMWS